MLFTTDKQTLDDLNIFGKQGGDGVFHIYNRTHTRGGAAILEEMFRYPLADGKAINARSSIICRFAEQGIVFPFRSAHFDEIEAYLANTDERTRLTQQESVGKKLGNMIAMDVETAVIYKGILALVQVLKATAVFMASPALAAMEGYRPEREAIAGILAGTAFEAVLRYDGKSKIPHPEMAAYDALFRFRHRDTIRKLLRYLYLLDVYLSVAAVARERGFVFPVALPGSEKGVRLEGVYHPQVKAAIPNNIHIDSDGNVIFLTGANMAGKSTFMKSLSIALFVAHMGFPVAASKMEFSVLDGIYTTINLPDNLGMGASHFYAEVLRVKKMVQELRQSKRLFIVFDEMFRGTNVKDAYEATIAITAGFALKRESIFIISTHIIEAGDVLKEKCSNVRFHYLPTLMNGNTPVYTYTLEQGITADRHGMVIINNEGILGILRNGKKKNFKSQQQHELYNG
jgi:DNA mismatch repair ATPase MutS